MLDIIQDGMKLSPLVVMLLSTVLTLLILLVGPRLLHVPSLTEAPPGDNPLHQEGTKLKWGGVAVVGASLVVTTLSIGTMSPWRPLVLYVGGLFVVGLLDDTHPLTPGWKITLQVPMALLVLLSMPRMNWIHIGIPWVLIQVAWLTVMTHGYNIIDIADGLLAAATIPTLAALGFLFAFRGPADLSCLALAMCAALLVFLVFNASPGRFMLGDSGSLPVGGLVSLMVLLLPDRVVPGPPALWAFPLTGLAFFEVVWVSTARIRRGIPPWRASPHHFVYRLKVWGLSDPWAVVVLALCQFLMSLAVGLAAAPFRYLAISGAALFMLVLLPPLKRRL